MAAGRQIHIGTSGWSYKHWLGPFYPEDFAGARMLSYYAERFRTVEINNSFYHLPSEKSLQNWSETVGDDFLFAVKASRYITHMKKLKDPAEPVSAFLERLQALGDSVGPVLFQLPPKWRCNPGRLQDFLAALPGTYRYTFEFRDRSWFSEETFRLLRQANAAFCIYEIAGNLSPREVTADFVYIRLHGPTDVAYQGSYGNSALADWAGAIEAWSRQGRDVFCYFDNDQNGFAANNARQLREMLSRKEKIK